MSCRNLCLLLGDQLDRQTPLLESIDAQRDVLWFAECAGEAGHVWSHKARIALFFAAMREFAAELAGDYRQQYWPIGQHSHAGLSDALAASIAELQPESVRVVKPGSHRVEQALRTSCELAGVKLIVLDDPHFFAAPVDFADWARGRKSLRQEYFYREMRKRFNVLMESGKPLGGQWNFDAANRGSFANQGPGLLVAPPIFKPSEITRGALADVQTHFADHPGSLEHFNWPVTPADAERELSDFIDSRLVAFGQYQDAMWTDEPWLYHSKLSAALNLKLIRPHRVVAAAEQALREGRAPIEAVEGFVRQLLGWREYVRGLYWLQMPDYVEQNSLNATEPLPAFFWTAKTDMQCQRQVIGQTLEQGYAHHIQRLMVTGLFGLLMGVEPKQVHQWYLAVYVDAVEWVEVPNVFGMSQYADGGTMASKPYIASGKYIQRMSNYRDSCKFNPAKRVGPEACPITTLYWDFLQRHADRFARHPRLALQWRNLERLSADERQLIRQQADALRRGWAEG